MENEENIQAFFSKALEKVRGEPGSLISEMAEVYVLDLLCRALENQGEVVFDQNGEGEPLALLWGRAMKADHPQEQFSLFKRLSDRTLYFAGYFSDHLARRSVDIDYYMDLGTQGYQQLSNLAESRRSMAGMDELFWELSEKFAVLVDLLAAISADHRLTNDEDVLRLYERWLKTKSPRLYEKLSLLGIMPQDLGSLSH